VNLRTGDRVRVECMGDDGLPLVRYGFVGGIAGSNGPIIVMLDGELGGDVIDLSQIQPVTVTTVELCLTGDDLTAEPELRRGLVALWQAEADTAGLDVDALHPLGDGLRDSSDSWVLAELTAGGEQYVVRAFCDPHEPNVVRVRADRPNRWDV
jgi:hypothetical protein